MTPRHFTRVVLTWPTADAALAELRTLGRNLHPARFPALRGKAWRQTLRGELLDVAPAAENAGRIALTFEIIYGHALKAQPKVKVSALSAVSEQDMRAMLQGARGAP